jgi:hypothetical protein
MLAQIIDRLFLAAKQPPLKAWHPARRQIPINFHKHVLQNIFRVVVLPNHARNEIEDRLFVLFEKLTKGFHLTRLGLIDQLVRVC